MIEVGEVLGVFVEIFGKVVVYFEFSVKLNKKVKFVMIYLIVVIGFVVVFVNVLFIFVILVFVKMFVDFGKVFFVFIQLFIDFSNFFCGWGGFVMFIVIVVIVVVFKKYVVMFGGCFQKDYFLVCVLIFGNFVYKIVFFCFCCMYVMLICFGVFIFCMFEIVFVVSGKVQIEDVCFDIVKYVS